ncbi:MAG: hypothetical protein ABW321_26480 [Polyangiales bacterium]
MTFTSAEKSSEQHLGTLFQFCASFALGAACWLIAAVSGAQGSSDWARPNASCVPECREGYECKRGECTPVCPVSCPDDQVCGVDGTCVSREPAPRPAPSRFEPQRRPRETPDACMPDCRSGYTCLEGRCVSMCNPVCAANEYCNAVGECLPVRLQESREEWHPQEAPRPTRTPAQNSLVDLHIDVAGAAQLGLTPTVEVGETVSGYLQLRVMNTGLLSYFVLGRDGDDDLRLGLGAALGMHIFTADTGNRRGFYGGIALEYAYLETRDTTTDFARYRTHVLVPQLDLGHRWAFGEFLVGVSAKLGLAIPIDNSAKGIGSTPCARERSCVEDLDVAFIPGLAVDLGWFIPHGN